MEIVLYPINQKLIFVVVEIIKKAITMDTTVTKGLLLVCLANRTTWTRGFLTLHVSDLLYCQYLAFLVPWLRGSTFSMYDDILTSN